MSHILSEIGAIWTLLDRQTKRRFLQITAAMASVNILDLLAIFLFATFAAGTFDLMQGKSGKTRLELFLSRFFSVDLEQMHFLTLVVIGMMLAFIIKSSISALLNRKILFFLAKREIDFASRVMNNYLKQNADEFYSKSQENMHYASGISVSRMFNGVLFPLSQILNDCFLLTLVLLALVYTSPFSSIIGALFFGTVIFVIGRKVHESNMESSKLIVKNTLLTQESTRELYEGYREIVTKPYATFNESKFMVARSNLAFQQARLLWVQQIPRFSIEVLVIFSAAILGFLEFLLNDTRTALVKLSVFMVTVFRIIPSIQRIQSSTLAINGGIVASQPALSTLKEMLGTGKETELILTKKPLERQEITSINLQDVTYKFGTSDNFVFEGITCSVSACRFIGLLGESGVGKSTLIDCITGLRIPSRGAILFFNKAGEIFEPQVALVPQKPFIANTDLLTNIALETKVSDSKRREIEELFDFFFRKVSEEKSDADLDLSTEISMNMNSLSGGQAQRISIIRALISNAELVILDESFAGISERMTKEIIAYLKQNYKQVTFLLVSHSFSILQQCDVIYKLEYKELTEVEI